MFHFINTNFLAGREFKDWTDLNQQARDWCDKVNATKRRSLQGSSRELFLQEQHLLRPLPLHIPTVYLIDTRIVDGEGYINILGNRYSVPDVLLGRRLEVRVTKDRIEVYDGPREVASHARVLESLNQRQTDPQHRRPRGQGRPKAGPRPEEVEILRLEPAFTGYLTALRSRCPGKYVRMLRQLLSMVREYPRQPLLAAVRSAEQHGLYDLDRVDRMVLRNIAEDYFVLAPAGTTT